LLIRHWGGTIFPIKVILCHLDDASFIGLFKFGYRMCMICRYYYLSPNLTTFFCLSALSKSVPCIISYIPYEFEHI